MRNMPKEYWQAKDAALAAAMLPILQPKIDHLSKLIDKK